jgi:hypothetical protein
MDRWSAMEAITQIAAEYQGEEVNDVVAIDAIRTVLASIEER